MSNGPELTAYDYFRFGHDTMAIAEIMKISEAEALERVNVERSRFINRMDPYVRRSELIAEKNSYRRIKVA